MTIKRIITSDLGKDAAKQILKQVDDIVTKGKAKQNPEKLLQEQKKKVLIDGKKAADVARSETVLVKTKIRKPKVSKETEKEFFESWGVEKNAIGPKILKDFNINKIETNDDIYRLIDAVSKSQSNKIFKFKRGVRSQKVTGAAAARLRESEAFIADVLGKKAGDTFNAEQILALRQLLVAGKNRLLYLANKASDDINSTADDVLKFRQHHALMAQMQKVLKGVQTETARALNQFKIPVKGDKFSFTGGNIDDLNKNELIVQLGGVDEIRNVAKLFVSKPTSDTAMLKAIDKTGLESYKQKTSNAIAEIFLNAILSNPLTHMRNGLGNWITQAVVQQERKLASRFFSGNMDELNQGMNYISPYEDVAKAWGKHMASKEIMAAMKDTFKISGSKIETRIGQVTSQNFGIKHKTGAAAFDAMGKVLTLGNLPTKFLQISDDYFKNAEFRSEIYARAFSDGMEKYSKGLLKQADLPEYIAGKVANPDKQLIEAAYRQAQYVTYQTPLGKRGDVFDAFKIGQQLKTYSANRGPWSWLTNYYLPFVRTPTNIAGFVAERTPVLAQVLTRYNQKIAAGGRTAAQAKAQLALGSMFYLATAPLGYYGVIKGSGLEGVKSLKTGGKSLVDKTVKNEPFSLNIPIGDGKFQKISVRGFDPVAQMFAASGNFGQMLSMFNGSIYNNLKGSEKNYGQMAMDSMYYAIAFSFALGENLANSTMLSGAGKLIDDARKLQSGFRSGNFGQAFKEVSSEFATSFIPTVVREGGKLFNDEHQKIAKEFSEYAKRNIAESDLEYDYDMRGRKFDKFAYFTQYEKDELDEELNSVFPRVTPIRNKIPFPYDVFGNSVSIPLKSDEIRFLRKNTGLYFDRNFRDLVQRDEYKNATRRFEKEGFIRAAWQDAKKEAKAALLSDTDYDDGLGGTVNYFKNIEQRANELVNKNIANSQRGYINTNDNINDNNQE